MATRTSRPILPLRTRPSPRPLDGPARAGAPGAQRRRGVGPARRHRGGGCGRTDAPRPGRPGPAGQPALDGQAVRPGGAAAGRRHRRVRPHLRGARGDGLEPLRRGPARPDAPGAVPPDRRGPGDARLWDRGIAAGRPDRGAPRARRRAAEPGPPHVLRTAHGVPAAGQAGRLGPGDVLAGGPPGAGRLPRDHRGHVRCAQRAPDHRARRLWRAHLRVPAPRRRSGLRHARGSRGDPVGRPACPPREAPLPRP